MGVGEGASPGNECPGAVAQSWVHGLSSLSRTPRELSSVPLGPGQPNLPYCVPKPPPPPAVPVYANPWLRGVPWKPAGRGARMPAGELAWGVGRIAPGSAVTGTSGTEDEGRGFYSGRCSESWGFCKPRSEAAVPRPSTISPLPGRGGN